ncbi:unnamed protein product [Cyprideis torosa]|uniref:Uncharacterized protein n=1 Tax=Cyprideis torosa TaxID=163714 RepID=A0A7R8WFG6_9CRUS|nr:unnamed protein product [Cyprideis torosa]CAG0891458.1 unnamed protein product [Cyprideis torosa]
MEIFCISVLLFGLITTTLQSPEVEAPEEAKATNPTQPANCPPWFFPLGDSCYSAGWHKLNWTDSQNYCGALAPGGRLVEFETAEEFNLIKNHLLENPLPTCHAFWIGAEEIQDTSEFQWASTASPLAFYDWYSTQPDSNWANDSIFISCTTDWQWFDGPKWYDEVFQLCELPLTKAAYDHKGRLSGGLSARQNNLETIIAGRASFKQPTTGANIFVPLGSTSIIMLSWSNAQDSKCSDFKFLRPSKGLVSEPRMDRRRLPCKRSSSRVANAENADGGKELKGKEIHWQPY